MTEIVTTKSAAAICKACKEPIFYVTLWTGKKIPMDKGRITIINKIKEDVWTTTSGYLPHETTCQKGGEHENDAD